MLLIQPKMLGVFPDFPSVTPICMLLMMCCSSFQDPSPVLNEVPQPGTEHPTSITSISKSASAYPSTTIVNPTIVLLQHNRGKETCTEIILAQNEQTVMLQGTGECVCC